MSQQVGEQFVERLMDDPSLRAQFQSDPAGTLSRAGIDLSAEEIRALEAVDWHGTSDQELAERVSKVGVTSW